MPAQLQFKSLKLMVFAGACRRVTYLPEVHGKRLTGHIIRSQMVRHGPDCQVQCYVERFCLSYNLKQTPSNGLHACELSSSDAIRNPADLISHVEYSYTGTKVSAMLDTLDQQTMTAPVLTKVVESNALRV